MDQMTDTPHKNAEQKYQDFIGIKPSVGKFHWYGLYLLMWDGHLKLRGCSYFTTTSMIYECRTLVSLVVWRIEGGSSWNEPHCWLYAEPIVPSPAAIPRQDQRQVCRARIQGSAAAASPTIVNPLLHCTLALFHLNKYPPFIIITIATVNP